MNAEPPERTEPDPAPSPRTDDVVIAVDAMGGDRGVGAVIGGLAQAVAANPRLRFIVHGDEAELEDAIRTQRNLAPHVEVRHAEDVITMSDRPSKALRTAQGSSMWNALESVRTGESEVVISCGNTGALMA